MYEYYLQANQNILPDFNNNLGSGDSLFANSPLKEKDLDQADVANKLLLRPTRGKETLASVVKDEQDGIASSNAFDSQIPLSLNTYSRQSFESQAFSMRIPVSQRASGYYFIDALLFPNSPRWSNFTLTYSFMNGIPNYYAPNTQERNNYFIPLNNTQRNAARRALQLWSEVSGLKFVEVSDAGFGGTIRFGTTSVGPGSAYTYIGGNNSLIDGDIWLNNRDSSNLTQNDGSFGFTTMIHEIGHALWLKHPGNYNAGGGGSPGPFLPYGEDSTQYTLMSYNTRPQNPQTPMLYDIAAIQYLYGANYNTRSGNNTYAWNFGTSFAQTIWDGGGIDTISAANQTMSAIINLNPGTFSSIGPESNYSSYRATNNLAIAFGVTIENAIGGTGNDALIGNAAANSLSGGSGNDTLLGDSGNDILVGGLGKDILTAGNSTDTFTFNALSESLLASYDIITDYVNGEKIDAPNSILAANLTTSVGRLASLSSAAISSVLNSNVFTAKSAKAFTVNGLTGAFIGLNDSSPGFNSATDSIIYLQGYTSGSITIV